MIIAATGHRPDKLGDEYYLRGPYSHYIQKQMYAVFDIWCPDGIISGMALGVDLLWAEAALNAGIPVTAAIPFEGQECKWPMDSRNLYHRILSATHSSVYVSSPGYSVEKMHKRNRWMVDHCDVLLSVWDGSEGGTAACTRYAQSINKSIIPINPCHYLKTISPP